MSTQYSELQLDALRELANVGSGTAASALSALLGRGVDLSVSSAFALPVADAVDAVGDADEPTTAIVLPIVGDLEAVVLLLVPPPDAEALCGLLGVSADSEVGASALAEIGNILAAAYAGALGELVGLALEPAPPQLATDMLGAVVASVLTDGAAVVDLALLLDSRLTVEGVPCSLSFMLVPRSGAIDGLLGQLGLGG